MSGSNAQPTRARLAAAGVLAVGVLCTAYYAKKLDAVYPMREWLFWVLARLWFWVALFNLACASFGQWLLARVLRLKLPVLESAVVGMALGVVAFVLAMYVGGAFAWYGPRFAVLLPCAMIAVGARDGVQLVRALYAASNQQPRRDAFAFAITAAGVMCVGLIYLGCMTPDALNYDSTWCHLVESQDYARAGRIIAFPADYTKNMPQLASLIHTWGYVVPGLDQPALRWMLALHNEFGLFVWTLAGVSAGARYLAGEATLRGAWVSLFFFPVIFVYDHNLGGAGDHVCAFFAIPIMLLTLRVCASFSRSCAAALAAVSAGAVLTKYQAFYMLLPAALLIGFYFLRALAEHRPRARALHAPSVPLDRLLRAPLIVCVLGLVLVSPHFIRQAIFHHNPVYPFLQDVFRGSTPTSPDAAFLFSKVTTDTNWVPKGTLLQRFVHALALFFTFSFEPHYSFVGAVPVFGSLFSLLLPVLVFVRDRARIVRALVIASVAIVIWGMVYNVDRNLQIFMPILVCITCALLVKAWRAGALARFGVAPLVALQIVWGGDIVFFNSYSRIEDSFAMIRSGLEHRAGERLSAYRSSFIAIGHALPKDAKVLLHTTHVSLGIDREVVLDWLGFQSLVSYARVHSSRELYDYYRSLGITHLLDEPNARAASTKQGDVLWSVFVSRYAEPIGSFGGRRLMRMPHAAPPLEPSYRVATLALGGYLDGIYPIARMTAYDYVPAELRQTPHPELGLPGESIARADALAGVDAIFVGHGAALDAASARLVHLSFVNAEQISGEFTLYVRRAPR